MNKALVFCLVALVALASFGVVSAKGMRPSQKPAQWIPVARNVSADFSGVGSRPANPLPGSTTLTLCPLPANVSPDPVAKIKFPKHCAADQYEKGVAKLKPITTPPETVIMEWNAGTSGYSCVTTGFTEGDLGQFHKYASVVPAGANLRHVTIYASPGDLDFKSNNKCLDDFVTE